MFLKIHMTFKWDSSVFTHKGMKLIPILILKYWTRIYPIL